MKQSRLIQIAILSISMLLLMGGLAIYGMYVHTDFPEYDLLYERSLLRTSGVVSVVTEDAWEAIISSEENFENVYEVSDIDSSAQSGAIVQPAAMSDFELLWSTRVIANVSEYMTVREAPDKNSAALGKLKKGDLATYMGEEGDWYQVTSGNLTGYVSKEYAVRGQEAYDIALATCSVSATTTGSGLRIRSTPSTEGSVVKAVSKGTKLIYLYEENLDPGWVHVRAGASTGYVSSEYVVVDFDFTTAETANEEYTRIAKEKAALAEAKRLAAEKAAQTEALIASVDDLMLLAALIQIEAGAEAYEGQVAVGAVVMNRVKSKTYPNTIKEVIYQKSQFSTAKIPTILKNGPWESCIKAAREAMDGKDPTGGCIGFKAKYTGQRGYVIGKQVFF